MHRLINNLLTVITITKIQERTVTHEQEQASDYKVFMWNIYILTDSFCDISRSNSLFKVSFFIWNYDRKCSVLILES